MCDKGQQATVILLVGVGITSLMLHCTSSIRRGASPCPASTRLLVRLGGISLGVLVQADAADGADGLATGEFDRLILRREGPLWCCDVM
jgi:hypothetical protein